MVTTGTRTRADIGPLAREIASAGALAGVAGGAAMVFYMMLYSEFWGAGFWLPLRLLAATFFGVDALIGGAGVIIAGLLIQLAVSAALGILYALIPRATTTSFHALLGGIGYGVLVLLVGTFMILPAANPVLRARVALTPMAWFLAHAIFGALMGGVVMPLRRRFGAAPLV
jgi:hypothetical protein